MTWRQVLAEAGIAIEVLSDGRSFLYDEMSRAAESVVLLEPRRTLVPTKVPPLPPGEHGLLALPRASEALVLTARARRWNVVTDNGILELSLGEREFSVRPPANDDPTKKKPGPAGWALYSLVRIVAPLRAAKHPHPTQLELARMLHVSQPSVSRSFANLRGAGLADALLDDAAPDDSKIADWWLENYPGPGGVTTYWYGLDAPVDQAKAAAHAIVQRAGGARAALSGEVAADQLAPWRRPTSSLLYATTTEGLRGAGFVPVAVASDATLRVIVPKDPGLWLSRPWYLPHLGPGVEIADPLQVLFDLRDADSNRPNESYDRLVKALSGPLLNRWIHSRIPWEN